jgi:hypothetical protein
LTIATLLGSESARKRAASEAATPASSGGDPGQQHGLSRTARFVFIDDHQCIS